MAHYSVFASGLKRTQEFDIDILFDNQEEPTSVLDLTSCISPPLPADVWTEQMVQYSVEQQLDNQQQRPALCSSWDRQGQNQAGAAAMMSGMDEKLEEPPEFESWASDLSFEALYSSSNLPNLEGVDDETFNMDTWFDNSEGSSITDDRDSPTAIADLEESSCLVEAVSSYDGHQMTTSLHNTPTGSALQLVGSTSGHNPADFVRVRNFEETADSITVADFVDDFNRVSSVLPCVQKQQMVAKESIPKQQLHRAAINLPSETQKRPWVECFSEPDLVPNARKFSNLQPCNLHPLPYKAQGVTGRLPTSTNQHHSQVAMTLLSDSAPAAVGKRSSPFLKTMSNLPNSSTDVHLSKSSSSSSGLVKADLKSPGSLTVAQVARTYHGGMITQLDMPQGVGRMGVEINCARARMGGAQAGSVKGGGGSGVSETGLSRTEAGGAAAFKLEQTQQNGSGVRMVQLLLACAEAVACRDSRQAAILLQQLQHMASPYGDSMQRVTACFVEGLTARLAVTASQSFKSCSMINHPLRKPPKEMEKDEGFKLMHRATPYVAFGHYAANSAILNAFQGEDTLHIVDLGMTHGLQWPYLIDRLSSREGGPPRLLRITGLGLATDMAHETGRELTACAKLHRIPFEFRVVAESLENLQPSMLELREGEALAVNSVLQLHCVVKESRGSLNTVLQHIHELCPRVLTLVEQDASHNGPFFLGRFMEALHYYSAIFDSLDASLPRYSHQRVKIEQFHFGEEIKNIVSCEGPARVERHERVDQWRRRMSRAGFQPLPSKFLHDARMWLTLYACDGYTLAEEKGCLVLGWRGKSLVAASSWRC